MKIEDGNIRIVGQKTKAALTLLMISPILAEMLSGSSPPLKFFFIPYLLLQLITYGIPALIIRELALRWKNGLFGIFLLGCGYGIFNEGLVSHTFLGYHYSVAWIVYICVWHALHSILFPILITYFWFPEAKTQSWLGNKTFIIFMIFAITESIVMFFGPHTEQLGLFVLYWLIILVLAGCAKSQPGLIREQQPTKTYLPILLGLVTLIVFFVVYNLIKFSSPGIIAIILEGAMFYGIWLILKIKHWLNFPIILIYASGSYIATAIFALFQFRPDVIVASIIMIVLLILFTRKIINNRLSVQS